MSAAQGLDWKLDDILGRYSFASLCSEIETRTTIYGNWLQRMKPDMDITEFAEFLRFEQELMDLETRLNCWADLRFQEKPHSNLRQRQQGIATALQEKITYAGQPIDDWLSGKSYNSGRRLNRKDYYRLRTAISGLEYYFDINYLNRNIDKRKTNNNTFLTERSNGHLGALAELQHAIYSFEQHLFHPKGIDHVRRCSTERLIPWLYSDSAAEREAAHRAFFETAGRNIDSYFLIFKLVSRINTDVAIASGFASCFEKQCYGVGITPQDTIKVLAAVARRLDVFERYFQYKAKLLHPRQPRIRKLDSYDLNFKVHHEPETQRLGDSLKIIDLAFRTFSPEFADEAQMVIKEKHLRTKHLEAGVLNFSRAISPQVTPYVYLDDNRDLDSYVNLAHELGHAAHFGLAKGNWPTLFEPGTLLSEATALFSELIALDAKYNAASPREKKAILETKIDSAYRSIAAYACTTQFEIKAHRAITKGASAEDVSQIYDNLVIKYFRKSIKIPPIERYGWTMLDIFEEPFYGFSYCFGMLVALELYARYKTEGSSCVPDLLRLWRAGGSKETGQLLKEVKVDPINNPKIIAKSFDMIGSWIGQLERT